MHVAPMNDTLRVSVGKYSNNSVVGYRHPTEVCVSVRHLFKQALIKHAQSFVTLYDMCTMMK